jgi:hypothetical protein
VSAAPIGLLPPIPAARTARARWEALETARRTRWERDREAWINQPPPELELPLAAPAAGTQEFEDWEAAWDRRREWSKRGARLMHPLRPLPFQLPIPAADDDLPPREQTGPKRGTKARNPLIKLLRGRWPQRGQCWLQGIPRTTAPRRKPHAIGMPPLRAAEKEAARELAPTKRLLVLRPKTRDDCRNGPRPCPWVGCRRHLYLDVNPRNGSIKYNFPGMALEDLEETCASDVEERGGVSLQKVGDLINVTLERVRQIEQVAVAKIRALHEGETFDQTGYDDETEEREDDVGETTFDVEQPRAESDEEAGW